MSGWLFDNASAYARATTGFLTVPPFTILCVFQTSSLAATQCPWVMAASGTTSQNWRIQVNTDGTVWWNCAAGSTVQAQCTNTVTLNVPQYFVGVAVSDVDRTGVLNGDFANKGTNTTSRVPTGVNRLSFGMKDDSSASNPLSGVVHYAALWGAALDDAEIKAISAGAVPSRVRPASLLSYWPSFGRHNGSVIPDRRGRAPLTINLGQVSALAARRRARAAGGVAA